MELDSTFYWEDAKKFASKYETTTKRINRGNMHTLHRGLTSLPFQSSQPGTSTMVHDRLHYHLNARLEGLRVSVLNFKERTSTTEKVQRNEGESKVGTGQMRRGRENGNGN